VRIAGPEGESLRKGESCLEHQPEFAEIKETPSRIFQLWKIYRDYILSENLLIHQRLQRMLAVQGFLFAALGLSISEFNKRYTEFESFCEVKGHASVTWPYMAIQPGLFLWFGVLIAGVAMTLVWFSGLSLKATRIARKNLHETFDQRFGVRAQKLGLPELRGGGVRKAHQLGDKHLKVLPWILIGMWAVIAVVLVIIAWRFTMNPAVWLCH
jgi:hypothetical protein